MYSGLPGLVVPSTGGPKSRGVPVHPSFPLAHLTGPGPVLQVRKLPLTGPVSYVPHSEQLQWTGSGGRLVASQLRS